jgi:hypothetical protein
MNLSAITVSQLIAKLEQFQEKYGDKSVLVDIPPVKGPENILYVKSVDFDSFDEEGLTFVLELADDKDD